MITVENLVYSYPGKNTAAVDGISFEVKKGEVFGFLGPNGAGKSTTQKILIGLLKGFAGKVSILGSTPGRDAGNFYERIGVAFEFPNLYGKFSALENLEFFGSLYNRKGLDPMELLRSVGLEKDAKTRVNSYSKGMKMRLNYIRAFLNDPELVFLDEPTSGLDPVNARIIKDLILKARDNGKTVFLTTHNMLTADELCDRVAFMVEGKLRLIDSPRTLKLNYGKAVVRVESLDKGKKQAGEFPLENIGTNREFLAFLKKGSVEMIHTQEASLDDIFINTTGRSLT
ncbi:MAG: ABC transporter ATP-binding protein [Spirochaetales bacterium]|nr:ABC transporter ATP-binding protein [Spirochaetales bacterium]